MTPRLLLLYKPKGYEVTRPKTLSSEAYPGQKTVYSLLPDEFHEDGWVPVGRLDKDSSGLLLFVKEGFLVARLQKPGNMDKVYEVLVKGRVEQEHLKRIAKGVGTPLGPLAAKAVEVLDRLEFQTLLRVTLSEGKNKQIRRIFAGLKDGEGKSMRVLELKRVRLGPIELDGEEGSWRYLSEAETQKLLAATPPKARKGFWPRIHPDTTKETSNLPMMNSDEL